MSLHKEIRADGRVILVDGNTGKIVDHVEVRDGIMYYIASDGQVLESEVVVRQYHFVCTACGERCEAGNLTGYRPSCPKGYPAPGWEAAKA